MRLEPLRASGMPSLFSFVFLLLGSSLAMADPPRIDRIKPAGAPQGAATPIEIGGANLQGNPRLIAPFVHQCETAADGVAADGTRWAFQITVDPNAAPGVHVIRVRTDDGVSNPFLFAVGTTAQVVEQEANNTTEQAQAIGAPIVVDGEAAGNDVDFFRFPGKKGQRIVVDAHCARIGSGVDPAIRLTTAGGRFVASDDDTPGLMSDARIVTELPEDGDYLIELSDSKYQGANRPVYRLVIGEVPTVEEVYPLGGRRGETVGLELRGLPGAEVQAAAVRLDAPHGVDRLSPATSLELPTSLLVSDFPEIREPADESAPPLRAAVPVVLNGRLADSGDEDRFQLVGLTPGQKLRVRVQAMGLASGVDGVLDVLGPDGKAVAQGDDANVVVVGRGQKTPTAINSPDPRLEVAVPNEVNTLTLVMKDLSGRGGLGYPYRIVVEEAAPTFELELQESEANIPRDGWVNVNVLVGRLGYDGPIQVALANTPPGVTVRGGLLTNGQAQGVLSLGIPADGAFDPTELVVEGRVEGQNIPVRAFKPVIFAAQQAFPTKLEHLPGLYASPTSAKPLRIATTGDTFELVRGFGVEVPLEIVRQEGATGALAVDALPLPNGLSVPQATIAEADTAGKLAVNAAPETGVGTTSIAFLAKGKIGGADRTFDVPAVSIQVVHPATLSLSQTAVELKPGQTVEVPGKLERKGPFQQAVTLKLETMVAGVSAAEVALAEGQTDFTLKLTAAADAPAGEGAAKLVAPFKLGDKDFPAPPEVALTVKVVP